MPRFDYVRAHSVEEAAQLLSEPGIVSRPLAGGTDLLVYIRASSEKPWFDRVVDVSRVPEMKVIELRHGEIIIGAAVTYTEAEESALLREHAACLVEACLTVGGPAIRNTGTIGGNAINAAACADAVPALICLEATAYVRSVGRARSLPVGELIEGPNRTGLSSGELLTHFTLPAPPSGARSSFTKLGRRNAQAISRLSVAAAGRLDSRGRVDYVRLATGAATPRPQRYPEVEAMLMGNQPTDALLADAGAQTAQVMVEITGRRWSTEYKETALQALVERTLRRVLCNVD